MTSQGRYGRTSGLSLQTHVEFALDKGPADDPALITGSWEQVQSDVESVRVSRGRKSEDSQMQAGKATIVLRNRTGIYKPGWFATEFEAGASDRANVPGRRVRIRVSDVGAAIEALRPDRFFELNEQSGQTAYDRGARNGTGANNTQDGTYAGPDWQLAAATPEWQSGPHLLEDNNKAPLFPGSGRYVNTVSNMPALVKASATASFTVSCWARGAAGAFPGYSTTQYVLAIPNQLYIKRDASNKIEVGVWDGSAWQTMTSTATMVDNVWRMLTVVFTPAEGFRLYVDGTFDVGGTCAITGTPAGQPLYIGALSTSATTTTWAGRIKDVAVWYDYGLSTEQIERLHTMSSTGNYLLNGFITAWSETFPDGPAGVGIVQVECTDATYTLAQQQIDVTAREFTTRLNPTKLFTFDDDKLEDLQGGPVAQFLQGSVLVQRRADEPDELQRTAGSVTTGVSSAALYFNPSASQMAQVLLPFPSDRRAPTAAMCWFKADGADRTGGPAGLEGRMVLLYSRKANGANWDHWFLGVNAKGVVITRKETRTADVYNVGSLVSSSEAVGSTYVCDGKWHHIAFLGSTVVVDGAIETATSGTFSLPDASLYRIFGGTYEQYGIDELAIWYDGTVAAADCEPIYRAASDQWEGQTADERCELLLDLAGWQTSQRDLTTTSTTRLGVLSSGSVWTLLQQAAEGEAGTVDCAGDGKVRLRSRHDRRRLGTFPTVGLTGTGGVGGYSDLTITSDELLLRTAAKIDDVYYEDTAAIGRYGKRMYSQSPNISTNEAAVRAKGIVDRYKGFKDRTTSLRFDLPTTHGGGALLLDVGDYVLAASYRRALPEIGLPDPEMGTFESHVEQIDWQFDANKRATVTCQLSPADPVQNTYWEIGTSTFGSADVLGW